MTNDYISRQAVHDLIAELLSDYLHDEDREKIEELDVKIEDLPSVTPKEKAGHWINKTTQSHCGVIFYRIECSECGKASGLTHILVNYCPNCGARMIESQGSEDKEVENG